MKKARNDQFFSNLEKFAKSIDVCTYEFENIPLETINKVNELKKEYEIR